MKRRFLIVAAVLAFFVTLGVGAVAGGALASRLLDDNGPSLAFAAPAFQEVGDDDGLLVSYVEPDSPAESAPTPALDSSPGVPSPLDDGWSAQDFDTLNDADLYSYCFA